MIDYECKDIIFIVKSMILFCSKYVLFSQLASSCVLRSIKWHNNLINFVEQSY